MGRTGFCFGRRSFLRRSLALAGLSLCSACGVQPPWTQRPANVPRIGVLSGPPAIFDEPFRAGLRELGYVEGQNIVIERRYDEGRADRRAEFLAELIGLKVDVLVAVGQERTLAASEATRTIPIVAGPIGDPLGTGLVASLAHPGGNLTGLTSFAPQLSGKRLELLREAVPGVSRVAVLWNSPDSGQQSQFRELEVAARALGLQLQSLEVRAAEDFDRVLAPEAGRHAGALTVVHNGFMFDHRALIFEFVARGRLPAMYSDRSWTQTGGLMAYGASLADIFRRLPVYVDKILKGASPATLPIEGPTTFEFVVNLKTAQALGLTIPPSVLQQASELIQ